MATTCLMAINHRHHYQGKANKILFSDEENAEENLNGAATEDCLPVCLHFNPTALSCNSFAG